MVYSKGSKNKIEENLSPLIQATKKGDLETFKKELDKGEDPATNDNEAIRIASCYGHTKIVKLLLSDSRVDPSTKDNYPIRLAAYNGHVEIVKLLLKDKRVDPKANDNFAKRYAVENGHTEIADMLEKELS